MKKKTSVNTHLSILQLSQEYLMQESVPADKGLLVELQDAYVMCYALNAYSGRMKHATHCSGTKGNLIWLAKWHCSQQ